MAFINLNICIGKFGLSQFFVLPVKVTKSCYRQKHRQIRGLCGLFLTEFYVFYKRIYFEGISTCDSGNYLILFKDGNVKLLLFLFHKIILGLFIIVVSINTSLLN